MKSQNLIALAAIALLAATSAHASVQISSDPTKNMNCASGVCAPTAQNAFLNTTDLANMLAAGDVKVVTGSGAVTITVVSPFSWTSTHRLTLDANLNVSFKAPVEVAGQGAVTITANDGGTGGDLNFFDSGMLDFWDLDSSLIINGGNYILEKNINQLSKAIASAPARSYALSKSYNAAHDSFVDHDPIHKLTGTFEGLGHVISNLTISAPHRHMPCAGLFGSNDGTARDVIVHNAKLNLSNVTSAGILIGCNKGLVRFSVTDGSVSGGSSILVGGLIGYNNGTVESSSSSASVSNTGSYHAVGGLIGSNGKRGTIDHSQATGSVSSEGVTSTGGLVGETSGVITRSYATGSIFGFSVGGLIGLADGLGTSECFATGNVSASGGSAGGLAADGQGITNSYSTGNVHAEASGTFGGLIGSASQLNSTSYSTGSVTGADGAIVGGSVGYVISGSSFANVFWDTDTSGLEQGCGLGDCSGVSGLTNTQLKAGLPTSFDSAIWGQNPSINNGYPYLINNPPPQ